MQSLVVADFLSIFSKLCKSKHLKGQLGPPVSDEKCLFVTKNDHFLKLCHEGQLGPPVSDEKCLFVTKNDHFLKLCHEGQMEPPVSDEKCLFSCNS